jgi:CheY-like chemotaxis protein
MPFAKNWSGTGSFGGKMAVAPIKPKILVVEDQPDVLITMTLLLQRVGCDVTPAQTGAEALKVTGGAVFDVITLDIDLPDIDGLELCRLIRLNPQLLSTRIVFVSGRFDAENRRDGFKSGAVDYIAKPFDAFAFASRILAHAKAGRATG